MSDPDVFEENRRRDETRQQTKARLMAELYKRDLPDGKPSKYVWVREFVQGLGGGLPYDTHNPLHFCNRYGMKPESLAPVVRVGLKRSTVEEMGKRSMIESSARECLRILSSL